jgi:hypothetical protein
MLSNARVFVLVLLAAAPAAGQSLAPLPPTLRDEAQALLRRGIPVALVLGPELQTALDARASAPRGAGRGDDRRARLTDLAARWAGRFDVFDDGTVVTLRDRTPSCLPQLERTFDATGISGPPSAVVHAFAVKLDPRLAATPVPGILGSGIGPIDDPEEEAKRAADGRTLAVIPVSLDGGMVSLQAALNELVAKAGSLAWAIGSERDADGREVCRIALLTRSTTLLAFHEIPPP